MYKISITWTKDRQNQKFLGNLYSIGIRASSIGYTTGPSSVDSAWNIKTHLNGLKKNGSLFSASITVIR